MADTPRAAMTILKGSSPGMLSFMHYPRLFAANLEKYVHPFKAIIFI
jgi:hypothetical protein